jgi:hypothetical protein
MCRSGSDSSSAIVLSSSVASPSSSRFTFLPERRERSRTSLAFFWNKGPMGIMRMLIAQRCTSVVMRASWPSSPEIRESLPVVVRTRLVRIDCAMTISPTISIRRSSLEVSTRTEVPGISLRGVSAAGAGDAAFGALLTAMAIGCIGAGASGSTKAGRERAGEEDAETGWGSISAAGSGTGSVLSAIWRTLPLACGAASAVEGGRSAGL